MHLVGQADDSSDMGLYWPFLGPYCQASFPLYWLVLPISLGGKAETKEVGGFNTAFQRCCCWVCRWWQQMTEMSSFPSEHFSSLMKKA